MTSRQNPNGPLAPFLSNSTRRARFSVTPARATALPPVAGTARRRDRGRHHTSPGLPKAGYSRNSHLGTGFRTRLRARVIHLRSGRGSLAHVACDLLGGSSVLQHLVAEAIADRTDIPLAGLLIGATHTHAGPGQFLGTDFYNPTPPNEPGFDPAWTHFLVDQIAGAVIEAHDTRGPARPPSGSTEVWGLTRNRSLDPHVQNEHRDRQAPRPAAQVGGGQPELHLLRVDAARQGRRTGQPLGALAVVSASTAPGSPAAPMSTTPICGRTWWVSCGRASSGSRNRPIVGADRGNPRRRGARAAAGPRRPPRGASVSAGASASPRPSSGSRLGTSSTTTSTLGIAFREIDLDTSSARRASSCRAGRPSAPPSWPGRTRT